MEEYKQYLQNYFIASHPLYFVRSGWLAVAWMVPITEIGDSAILWSETATNIETAYRITVNTKINPAYAPDGRWPGFSFRYPYLYPHITYATSPFYFSRGGYTDLNTGSHRCAGYDGYYWSGSASTILSNAYYFYFDNANTSPSFSHSRLFGFSVRVSTATSPFYFSRGGNVVPGTGSLRGVGYDGYCWSGIPSTNSSSGAYFLQFHATYTYPSYSYVDWHGFSVR